MNQLDTIARPRGAGRLACIVAGLAAFAASATPAQSYSFTDKLFDGNPRSFYHSFRIPSIVRATGDVLLAFVEGRVGDPDDWGNINLVYKRSTDNGENWSALSEIEGVGPGSWTNPTTVYEPPWSGHPQGRVHLFFNWHSGDHRSIDTIKHGDRRTYYTWSDDDGVRWAAKRDLTATLLPDDFTWDAVGPGAGIRKLVPPNVGRLVVPATRRNFHSDDHGATWHYTMMPTAGDANITGESTVAECLDGSLLRNDRATGSYWSTAKRRWVSRGQIGEFPAPLPQANLYDPRSHASMLRYNLPSPGRLIFLNSDSTETRRRMKVRISYDDGRTWPRERWLYVGPPPERYESIGDAEKAGKGGYSAMTKTGDFHVAALVEVDESFTGPGDHMSVDFHRFDLDWIRSGRGDPVCPELTTTVVGTLPNVTEDAFVFDGRSLDTVTTVYFDGVTITSQDSSTWSTGWFEVLSPTRIEVHPPQAQAPGPHAVAVASPECLSAPMAVALQRNIKMVLFGPSRPLGPFELFGSLGPNSPRTMALLAVSTIDRPTVVPGLVSFDIGDQAAMLLFVGGAAKVDASTLVYRWRIPSIAGLPPLFFQAAHYDPQAALPLPVTNVEPVGR